MSLSCMFLYYCIVRPDRVLFNKIIVHKRDFVSFLREQCFLTQVHGAPSDQRTHSEYFQQNDNNLITIANIFSKINK